MNSDYLSNVFSLISTAFIPGKDNDMKAHSHMSAGETLRQPTTSKSVLYSEMHVFY